MRSYSPEVIIGTVQKPKLLEALFVQFATAHGAFDALLVPVSISNFHQILVRNVESTASAQHDRNRLHPPRSTPECALLVFIQEGGSYRCTLAVH